MNTNEELIIKNKNLLYYWLELCNLNSIKHMSHSKKFKNWYNTIETIKIILSIIISIFAWSMNYYTLGSLSFLNTLMIVISFVINIQSTIYTHRFLSQKYSDIYIDIDFTLTLLTNREYNVSHMEDFIIKIKNSINLLNRDHIYIDNNNNTYDKKYHQIKGNSIVPYRNNSITQFKINKNSPSSSPSSLFNHNKSNNKNSPSLLSLVNNNKNSPYSSSSSTINNRAELKKQHTILPVSNE